MIYSSQSRGKITTLELEEIWLLLSMSAMLDAIVTFHIRARALRSADAGTAFGSMTATVVAVSFLAVAIVVQLILVWAKRACV
ncbi:hypothetical protein BJ742DRAFT_787914 [Cladochytrium replicatum]|nr:hypothetical protein BJ742DRAFT_787908 [Cladochytrium replicatum]KAI8813922.1 hypothetical protein BJ742DRAFT_787909 [Cladochytrium replicatum]KAI8813923.1 hypothetical protein BJ742DRAFT_787912 [Cladochytrium replicatum]KAI8813924.1 hypothetical protein BJ742DRAFT_787914 [Cladochytrium replicatum]